MRNGLEITAELTPFLLRVNSIFFTFTQDMMVPEFSTEIPTAAVAFSRDELDKPCIKFMFNPEFWDSLNYNEKIFVFVHEVLHVLFSHGKRGNEFFELIPKNLQSQQLLNISMDICINELILSQYLSDIPTSTMPKIMEIACFIDTVFEGCSDDIEKAKNFQYYYQKYLEKFGEESLEEFKLSSMDSHYFDNIDSELLEEIEEMIDNIINSEDEKEESLDNDKIIKLPGKGYSLNNGNNDDIINKQYEKPDHSLEKYFDLAVATSFYKEPPVVKTQWYGVNRRNISISKNTSLSIPIRKEIHKNNKHKILAYCDVSGSCENVSRKFISMISDLSDKKYEKDIYVFADRVKECKIVDKKISYSGAGYGTNINDVMKHYNNNMIKNKYDAVFVLTDGYYQNINHYNDSHYSNWHFFIIDNGITNCPRNSKYYKIA
jgi:predicted metal-dependent peptidase